MKGRDRGGCRPALSRGHPGTHPACRVPVSPLGGQSPGSPWLPSLPRPVPGHPEAPGTLLRHCWGLRVHVSTLPWMCHVQGGRPPPSGALSVSPLWVGGLGLQGRLLKLWGTITAISGSCREEQAQTLGC